MSEDIAKVGMKPCHPGEFIRTEILEELDLSISKAAKVEQTKAMLGAEIIGVLNDAELSTRQAQERTGVNHSEFARIRNVKLDRFTIDRLIIILNRLSKRVEFDATVRPARDKGHPSLGLDK